MRKLAILTVTLMMTPFMAFGEDGMEVGTTALIGDRKVKSRNIQPAGQKDVRDLKTESPQAPTRETNWGLIDAAAHPPVGTN